MGCLENLREDPRSRIVSTKLGSLVIEVSNFSALLCGLTPSAALFVGVCFKVVAAVIQFLTSSLLWKTKLAIQN